MFGAAVNLAACVAGQASGGQVLATTYVADAARREDDRDRAGSFQLRNIQGSVELLEVALDPERENGRHRPGLSHFGQPSQGRGTTPARRSAPLVLFPVLRHQFRP